MHPHAFLAQKQDKEFTLENAGLKMTQFGLFCNLQMGRIWTNPTVGYFNPFNPGEWLDLCLLIFFFFKCMG